MNCCLWFNRRKVSSAAEIPENMDIAALRGYFLGGSLIEWLREHDGGVYADRLAKLDPADPELNGKLLSAFNGEPEQIPKREIFIGNTAAAENYYSGGNGSFGSFRPFGSFGSFGSFSGLSGSGWLTGGSFSAGSFSLGSFTLFRMWEWEWEWRFGGSFRGSFKGAGSFAGLMFGSYAFGSGAYLLGSFWRNGGSFGGSYFNTGNGWLTPDEYDRIMYECLRRCPLDCFGYGIHIV